MAFASCRYARDLKTVDVGIVSGVDYLMVAMMPMMLAKLYMTISVDLFGYKNMMILETKNSSSSQ